LPVEGWSHFHFGASPPIHASHTPATDALSPEALTRSRISAWAKEEQRNMTQRVMVSWINFPAGFVSMISVTHHFTPKPKDTIAPRPPTSFPRARVRDWDSLILPTLTAVRYVPQCSQASSSAGSPLRLPPKRSITHDFAGLVAACHRIVSQESVLRCWNERHCAITFRLRWVL
jgi:hypothetical protein